MLSFKFKNYLPYTTSEQFRINLVKKQVLEFKHKELGKQVFM